MTGNRIPTAFDLVFSHAVHGQLEYIERDAGVMGLLIAHNPVVERADPNITEDQSKCIYMYVACLEPAEGLLVNAKAGAGLYE